MTTYLHAFARSRLSHVWLGLALSWLLGQPLAAQSDDWQLAKTENDIEVYTRKVPGEPLKAFRVVTTFDARAEDILAVITDADQGDQWQDRCTESRLLEQQDADHYLAYVRIDTPWPLQDRDLVVRVVVKRLADRTVVQMTNAPSAYPEQADLVRMPGYQGRWVLIPQAGGRTRVISEGQTSPGGSIPDWLANAAVIDSPLATMSNLRAQVEG